jgi:hypothetical protein
MATPSANTNMVHFIPEIWSKKLLKKFDKIVVMKKLINTDYEGEIKNAGDTVNVRQFGDVTIGNYTRDNNISFQALTPALEQMTITVQKYFAFTVDDLDDAQADINIMEGYNQRAAIAIRDVIDSSLLAHYTDADAANVEGSAASPVTLTKDNVLSYFLYMGELLDNQNVDEGSQRNAVVTPHVKRLIREYLAEKQTPLGDKASTKNGKVVDDFGGFTVYCSTNIPTATNAKPLLFFTRDFISHADQVAKVEKCRPYDMFADGLKGLYLYGNKTFTAHDGTGAVLYSAA